MQRLITQLAARWGLDLAADEAHLKLENRSYVPLVIEKVGPTLVSVAHYVEQNGDLCPDPEIIFFTGYGHWVPIEIAQRPPAGYRAYAELSPDGREIARLDPGGQAELGRVAEEWAWNLMGQGWLGESEGNRPSGRFPRAGRAVEATSVHITAFLAGREGDGACAAEQSCLQRAGPCSGPPQVRLIRQPRPASHSLHGFGTATR